MDIVAVTLIAATLHITPQFHQEKGLNDVNPGVMVHLSETVTGCSPTAGAYYNSYNRASVLVGCKYEKKVAEDFHLSATVGALTGYGPKVIPFAAPTASIGGVNFTWLPNPSMVGMKSGSTGVNLSYTIRF